MYALYRTLHGSWTKINQFYFNIKTLLFKRVYKEATVTASRRPSNEVFGSKSVIKFQLE